MARRQRWFWLMLVVLGTVIGIAVVGERERFGVAHICLPPIVFMGLALLAGSFARLARPVRWLVIAGCVVDFAIGILLHFHAQTFTFRLWAEGGRTFVDVTGGIKPLSSIALGNCWAKQANDVIFLGDHLAGYSAVLQVAIVAVFALVLAVLVREALRPRAAGAGSPPARSPRDTSGGSGPSSRKARSGSSRTRDRTSRRRPPRHAGR